jgi:hypothetical protein
MSTHGYSEEELAALTEEERAAIDAEVDETELTATASPVDLPDEEEEDEPPTGDTDQAKKTDEPPVKPEGDEPPADLGDADPERKPGGEDAPPEGDEPPAEKDEQGGPEYVDKDEPVNPFDYSDEAKGQIKELRAQLDSGDLSPAEYEEKADAIRSEDYRQRLQLNENQRWGRAVHAYLASHEDYQADKNPVRFAALDGEVRRLANSGEIDGLTHAQILDKARKNVEKAFGVPTPEPNADTAAPDGKEKPAPPPKPKAHVPDVPNLGDLPAAGVDNPKATGGEFAHLDKLTGADLEAALEKLTPTQQERYLAGR